VDALDGFEVASLVMALEADADLEVFLFRLFHGGEKFARIECLNDSPQGMAVLEAVVARELQGWI
jgi:protoheme ferro-lyase